MNFDVRHWRFALGCGLAMGLTVAWAATAVRADDDQEKKATVTSTVTVVTDDDQDAGKEDEKGEKKESRVEQRIEKRVIVVSPDKDKEGAAKANAINFWVQAAKEKGAEAGKKQQMILWVEGKDGQEDEHRIVIRKMPEDFTKELHAELLKKLPENVREKLEQAIKQHVKAAVSGHAVVVQEGEKVLDLNQDGKHIRLRIITEGDGKKAEARESAGLRDKESQGKKEVQVRAYVVGERAEAGDKASAIRIVSPSDVAPGKVPAGVLLRKAERAEKAEKAEGNLEARVGRLEKEIKEIHRLLEKQRADRDDD